MTDLITILAADGNLAQNAQAIATVPADSENYALEAKLDGWRIICHIHEDGVALYSRTGKRYDKQLPAVTAELAKRFPAGTWLDGEAVAITFNADGTVRNDWHVAQTALTKGGGSALADKITYVAFDLIALNGHDARPLPFEKRHDLLARALENPSKHVQISLTVDATQANHEKLVRLGFEGSVTKRLNAPYASGKRGHGWFKIKAVQTEDVVIMGFEQGKDVGGIIFGQIKDGKLVKRGTCKRKTFIPADASQVGNVIEVEFNQVTKDGALRHPRLLRRREDKTAAQCVWS
jgi:bifunctional non-homologous end joining protein LigD